MVRIRGASLILQMILESNVAIFFRIESRCLKMTGSGDCDAPAWRRVSLSFLSFQDFFSRFAPQFLPVDIRIITGHTLQRMAIVSSTA